MQLLDAPRVRPLALFITWWTILIELVIGLAFVFPTWKWLAKWRDPLLLLFLFTIYLFASIIGFGWLLAIMGIAQVEEWNIGLCLAYLVVLIVMQAYLLPWGAMLGY